MDLNTLIQQLPNFAGLLICIAILAQINKRLLDQNNRLVDVIVKRENCEEPPQ